MTFQHALGATFTLDEPTIQHVLDAMRLPLHLITLQHAIDAMLYYALAFLSS